MRLDEAKQILKENGYKLINEYVLNKDFWEGSEGLTPDEIKEIVDNHPVNDVADIEWITNNKKAQEFTIKSDKTMIEVFILLEGKLVLIYEENENTPSKKYTSTKDQKTYRDFINDTLDKIVDEYC